MIKGTPVDTVVRREIRVFRLEKLTGQSQLKSFNPASGRKQLRAAQQLSCAMQKDPRPTTSPDNSTQRWNYRKTTTSHLPQLPNYLTNCRTNSTNEQQLYYYETHPTSY